ncbi:F-box/kelch-repeat protein [Forsythia ovata]|uniref:F-box/kelch-repeat protein n=1 Tax=Forsythia ovata TaxID=205694 RepID=A0ABD1SB80_9LAMI
MLSSKHKSQSEELFSNYLPEDVLIEILVRIPPKSLIKFRCVSKSWNLLISSPYFISMHTQSFTNPSNRLMISRYSKIHNREIYSVHLNNEDCSVDENIKIEFPFGHSLPWYYRIIGSCNGVLCLTSDTFQRTNPIFLWNPAIRRKVELPVPQATFGSMGRDEFVLGFGFDVKNNDFKVVRIAYGRGDQYQVPHKVEIYELSVGKWREIDGQVPLNCVVEVFYTQVFLNEIVHWTAIKRSRRSLLKILIMGFSMTNEVFEEMPLPDALANAWKFNLNTAVYEESLAVLQYDRQHKSCCIWVMKEYGFPESWSKQFYVRLDQGFTMVLGFRKNGDVLLDGREGKLISYNPGAAASVHLGIHGMPFSFYIHTYVESLALLIEGKQAHAPKQQLQ